MDTLWLTEKFLGNTVASWILCAAVLLLSLLFNSLLARLASRLFYRFFKEVSQSRFFEEFSRLFQRPLVHVLNLVALYVAFSLLDFPPEWAMAQVNDFGIRYIIHTIYLVIVIIAVTRLFLKAAVFMEYVYHHLENPSISKDLATFLKELSRVLIIIISFFTILSKAFEVNITAVVASLGIGGLAIALAAQDTLANLIGSFIIYLDKPFQVGEIIEVGEVKGVVERIGFRTTRIRTLDRSLLIVPNKKIIDSNLTNMTQSNQRRVRFVLNLTYHSRPEQLQQILKEIQQVILDMQPVTNEDVTVRFADFDHSSLTMLVIYFVNTNDFDEMIAVKEKVNFKIMDIVKNNGCEFAFPTQTVHLAK